jgi:AGZA family xanthine/uracil permease-like MFS transporter
LASVVTGSLFTATLFLTPIAAVVPAQAAAPALVVIGGMMMAQCSRIPWQDIEFAIPVFLTIVLIPFTYSITNGIGAGLIAYVLIKVCKGSLREIGWLLGALAVVFAFYFGIEGVTSWL